MARCICGHPDLPEVSPFLEASACKIEFRVVIRDRPSSTPFVSVSDEIWIFKGKPHSAEGTRTPVLVGTALEIVAA
jgi:hypothetical protein